MLSVISESQAVQVNHAPCDILVVEDNTAVRKVLREILQEEGYHVHTVIHGQDALDYLSRSTTLPSVILLDLMMPIMTGWEFRALQHNHDRLRDIPVIVLSAVSHDVRHEHPENITAFALLTKPIIWPKLLHLIAQVVPNDRANVYRPANNAISA